MDRFNRLVMAALALAVAAASGLLLAAAGGLWRPPPGLAEAAGSQATSYVVAPGAGIITLAVGALLASLILFALEVRRRGPRVVLVSESEQGDVTVALSTIKEFVERVVERLSDVRQAVATVRPQPDGLLVVCHVEANSSAVLDALGESIREEVQREVADHLCLEVRRVEVHTRMSLRRHTRTVIK